MTLPLHLPKPLIVSCDLAVVLEMFSKFLFEHLDQLDLKELFLMAMLLALDLARPVSDNALPIIMQLLQGKAQVLLKFNTYFIRKVSDTPPTCLPMILLAFYPAPFVFKGQKQLKSSYAFCILC